MLVPLNKHTLVRNMYSKNLRFYVDIVVFDMFHTNPTFTGEPCWSLIAYSVDDVERFFKETIDNRSVFFSFLRGHFDS